MALSPKLELRQGQQLVMTPQLQQAIRLLQLSNIELSAFVETELERNPLLERDEMRRARPAAEARRREPTDAESDGDADWRRRGDSAERSTAPPRGDTRSETSCLSSSNGAGAEPAAPAGAAAAHDNALRRRRPQSRGLRRCRACRCADHLTEQLHSSSPIRAERLIGAHLIHTVDDAGYLRGRSRRARRQAGRAAGADRQACSPCCRASIRPACSRAIWPNAWRCSSRTRTATIRRSPALLDNLRSARRATISRR